MRAHARRQLNCRVTFRGRLRIWWTFQVRGRVSVRGRSQEAPDAKPIAGQWSPRRAVLRAQGTVPVRIRLWMPRPHMSIGPWSRRPPESSRTTASGPGKRHGELPGSMPSQPALFLDPRRVVLSDVGIGSHGERALAKRRVRSRDVDRADATLVSSSPSRTKVRARARRRLNCRVRVRGMLRIW